MTIPDDNRASTPSPEGQSEWAQPLSEHRSRHSEPEAWSATTGEIPTYVVKSAAAPPVHPVQPQAHGSVPPPKTYLGLVWALAGAVVVLAAGLIIVLVTSNKTNSDLRAAAAASSASASSSSSSSSAAAAALNATFVLKGTLTMPLSDTLTLGTDCAGTSGYDDIAAGTAVVVYDETNTIVATGYLGAGAPTSGSCVFAFGVSNVPGTAKFYQVEISHRGKITVSAVEAKAGEYAATLGN